MPKLFNLKTLSFVDLVRIQNNIVLLGLGRHAKKTSSFQQTSNNVMSKHGILSAGGQFFGTYVETCQA